MQAARWWWHDNYVFFIRETPQSTCVELYVTTKDTRTQTYAQLLPISTSFWNLEGLNEYLDEAINLKSSFEEKKSQIIWLLCLLFHDL